MLSPNAEYVHLGMNWKSKSLPPWMRNRYVAVLLGLMVYITFFDAYDLISQLSIKYRTHQLQSEIERLDTETEAAKQQIEQLTSDEKKLEQFAREHYRMKRDNEVVYYILRGD